MQLFPKQKRRRRDSWSCLQKQKKRRKKTGISVWIFRGFHQLSNKPTPEEGGTKTEFTDYLGFGFWILDFSLLGVRFSTGVEWEGETG